MPTVSASSRASSCAATAATAPVRSAVTERTSTSASGSPSVAEETQIMPITTGSPASGVLDEALAHALDRLPGRDCAQHRFVVEDRQLGHRGYATRPVTRNGQQ